MLKSLTDWLLDPSGLTPHGFCLSWEPGLIWTHALADSAIGLAYFSIPLALMYFARRRPDLAHRPVFYLFSAFILLCGTTHLFAVLTLWVPAYGLEAAVKVATAIVSVATAVTLWVLMPRALLLPSQAQVQASNAALRDSEARARESEARARAKYDNTPVPLHVLDAGGVIVSASQRWLDLLGYDRDEVLGSLISRFQAPGQDHAADDLRHVLETGEALDVPRRYLRRDGTVLDVLASGRVEREDGTPRILGALVDVTARVRAEAALRESEQRARLALAAVNASGTWDWDTIADVLYADASFAQIFGLDPAYAEAGAALADVLVNVPTDSRARIQQEYDHAMRAGGDHSFVHPVVQPNGLVRWFLAQCHSTLAPDGTPQRLQGVLIDITEQRNLEEQLRQSQKMEAVGQLTGGLAHDFNNMLQGIAGSLELLKARLEQGQLASAERYIVAAQGDASRAATLTQRLLAFSRRQVLAPEAIDVNELVTSLAELIQRTVGPGIKVATAPADDLWMTMCDPNQMESALLNLCINARDAMPDGGRLTIETANVTLDRRAAADWDVMPGEYVSVSVTDTGTGMSPEVMARAFDPFFTTKPLGMGTGLGLSMIYGFAQQSGGQARIWSELGAGTTVRIYLPRQKTEARPRPMPGAEPAKPAKPTGRTVLVVDDEPTVRMLVTDVLEELGYTVIEAEDGAGGLKVLQSGQRIDLLISDIGLPGGMNGRQMTETARLTRPDLKVLFITGYAPSAVLGSGRLEPGMQVITKPFTLNALAARIKALVSEVEAA
ncbi:hybrid sensor histidine kinase/response regulator [Rhodopila globiformis]|nr:PAS domain S-box protein [Rhodopila globiformis]